MNFFTSIDLSQLFADGWFPRRGMFSLPTVIAGTLIITIIAMAIAAPVGLFSAIYLAEYASPRVRGVVKPTLEILAGIPSVVLGFFALTWISPNVVRSIFPAPTASACLPQASVSGSSRSRSWHPSPKTRCGRSRFRSERRPMGSVLGG